VPTEPSIAVAVYPRKSFAVSNGPPPICLIRPEGPGMVWRCRQA
jgi:hypothetical protein